MQIKSLRVKSYRSWRINDNASGEAITRLKQLELYATLREEGCSEPTSLAAIGWSRATYYRWLKRYREDGLKGLESGPRAPRMSVTGRSSRNSRCCTCANVIRYGASASSGGY